MGKYRATVSFDACQTVDVAADSPEAAVDEAMEAAHVSLCHQCAYELQLGDALRVVCVEDVETEQTFDDLDPPHAEARLLEQLAALTAERDALRDALKMAREEFEGLPRSLGYEFTHLPLIEQPLAQGKEPSNG